MVCINFVHPVYAVQCYEQHGLITSAMPLWKIWNITHVPAKKSMHQYTLLPDILNILFNIPYKNIISAIIAVCLTESISHLFSW